MPFMSGPALAELLLSKKPGLKVLFTSGHTDDRAGFEKILEKGMQFLPKPFASDALIRKVRDTLNGGAAKTAGAISGGSD
jgi:FixJ family two-component response regulator